MILTAGRLQPVYPSEPLDLFLVMLWQFFRIFFVACPLWHAILDIHASLSIEDVTVWLEGLRDFAVRKVKQWDKTHPHVATLSSYGGVTSCAADFAWQFTLWALVLSVQEANLICTFDETDI